MNDFDDVPDFDAYGDRIMDEDSADAVDEDEYEEEREADEWYGLVARGQDRPRRLLKYEQPCTSIGHGPGTHLDWCCERPDGHTGDHMAWDIYPDLVYLGGKWT